MLKIANFDKTKKSFLGTQEGVLFAKPNVYNSKCVVSTPRTVQYIGLFGLKSTYSKKNILKKLKFEKTKIPSSRLHEGNIFPKGQLNPIYVTGCARIDDHHHHHDRCENMNPPSFA